MKISTLLLNNVRSFEGDTRFEFSPGINLLVGPNNSGKSTVIWTLSLLQNDQGMWQHPPIDSTLRVGTDIGAIDYGFDHNQGTLRASLQAGSGQDTGRGIRIELSKGNRTKAYSTDVKTRQTTGVIGNFEVFLPSEPENLFYLFLSRRKTQSYEATINLPAQTAIKPTLAFLAAKIDRLTGGFRRHQQRFESFLDRVLGYQLSLKAVTNGKSAGMYVGDAEEFIRIENMGEGIPNIAALLADLVVAQNRVFLIEELENDIHPSALRPLLKIIGEASTQNQFIISTHSHIVVSGLGAKSGSRIFRFWLDQNRKIPTTEMSVLDGTPISRLKLLEDLGYEMMDFGQWEGVLVLEESSAEAIIRDVIIPLFVPKLVGRLRTISAAGLSRVELTYDALHTTYLYLHLSPVYQDKSWVRIDASEESDKLLKRLREKFRIDGAFKFKTFSLTNFEGFYPTRFSEARETTLAITDKQARRTAKRELCLRVLDWALENPAEARSEFATSAAEVIDDLRAIETAMLG